jgi:hypothetical protein
LLMAAGEHIAHSASTRCQWLLRSTRAGFRAGCEEFGFCGLMVGQVVR